MDSDDAIAHAQISRSGDRTLSRSCAPDAAIFSKTVALSGPGGRWGFPFSSRTGGCRMQLLVLAAHVKGAGEITSIGFCLAMPSNGSGCPDITIRLVHTQRINLSAHFANNSETTPVEVLHRSALEMTAAAAGEFLELSLDRPFCYNGVDNLLVEIISAGCSDDVWIAAAHSEPPYLAVVLALDGGSVAGLPPSSDLPLLRFGFAAGESSIGGASNPYNEFIPFNDFSNLRKVQMLYPADAVCGAGSISGLALCVGQPSPGANSYTLSVTLGHAAGDELGPCFETNIRRDAPITRIERMSFRVPENLTVGTDVWIPLLGAVFGYNGRDHLILELDVHDARGTARWVAHMAGGTSRRALGLSCAATTGRIDSGSLAVKLRFANSHRELASAAGRHRD